MPIRRLPLALLLVAALGGAASAGPLEDGRKSLADGRNGEAAKAFREALKATPSSRDALLGLAKATFEGRLADGYEEVGALLREGLKAKPDDRELRLALAYHYLAWMDVDDRYRADVQDQFGRLQRTDPDDEEAAVGLARMYYAGADYRHGLEALDGLLAKKPSASLALYWKGQLLYDEATQAFAAAGSQWGPEVQALFQRAFDAFEASTKADGTIYDAWIKLGYAAQYLARVDSAKTGVAGRAYEKALDVDGEKDAAMRGLSKLFALEPQRWIDTLARLPKEHPKAPIVHFYTGYYLQQQGRTEEAEKAFRTFVSTSRFPAVGWSYLGRILAARKDDAGARKAFEESLKADPYGAGSVAALGYLQQPLIDREEEAKRDPKKAKDLLKEWEALAALAPQNIAVKNNLAFLCRDALDATKDAWFLKPCIKYYEEASALIGPWRPELEQTLPYPDRHGFAQVLNDTGLMYQYYKPVEDLAKAESYYRRAMEWSQHGYWDTYGNLIKILESAQRWQDAYDFASACAEGQRNADGTPNETHRATARADAARYEAKLPK